MATKILLRNFATIKECQKFMDDMSVMKNVLRKEVTPCKVTERNKTYYYLALVEMKE